MTTGDETCFMVFFLFLDKDFRVEVLLENLRENLKSEKFLFYTLFGTLGRDFLSAFPPYQNGSATTCESS